MTKNLHTCKNGLINANCRRHNPNNPHICWDFVTNCNQISQSVKRR